MRITRFEEVRAWQEARELAKYVYGVAKTCPDYGFRDQIQRAAVSVMNNIAEGFERNSDKEFKQFLYIAKGSCGEVRSMVYLALDLKYISEKQFSNYLQHSEKVSQLISGFIKKLQ